MEELLKLNVDDLVKLIKSHKEELQKDSETELEVVAGQIKISKPKVTSHFSKLLQELAEYIADFDIIDFPSLLLFIEKSGITGDELIWDYLKLVAQETNIERKTVLLKISYKLDPVWISKDILNKYQDIKKKYPLFWFDLLFMTDKEEAINKLGRYIKEEKVSFSSLYPVVNRWIRMSKAEGFSEIFKNNIYSWKSNFNRSDSELFQQWLQENGLNTQNNENIVRFAKDIERNIYETV